MSRIGKQPVQLPSGVSITLQGSHIEVKGPKGVLSRSLHDHVKVSQEENRLLVTVSEPEQKRDRSLWGLSQRLIANMVTGVTKGFEKQLEVNGIGYKVALAGKKLTFALGFSHPVEFNLPQEIDATVEKNIITIKGIDKHLVGEIAAQIRSLKKPEPYKGKGIKYVQEIIRRKAGKAGKAGGK